MEMKATPLLEGEPDEYDQADNSSLWQKIDTTRREDRTGLAALVTLSCQGWQGFLVFYFVRFPALCVVAYLLFVVLHSTIHAAQGADVCEDCAFGALAIAAGMCWFTNFPPSIGLAFTPDGYDNANLRPQKAAASGWIYRANCVHINTMENFPVFAAGFFTALRLGLDTALLGSLGWTFVLARVIYSVVYTVGLPDGFRSVTWFAGWLSCCMLYIGKWTGDSGFWYL